MLSLVTKMSAAARAPCERFNNAKPHTKIHATRIYACPHTCAYVNGRHRHWCTDGLCHRRAHTAHLLKCLLQKYQLVCACALACLKQSTAPTAGWLRAVSAPTSVGSEQSRHQPVLVRRAGWLSSVGIKQCWRSAVLAPSPKQC